MKDLKQHAALLAFGSDMLTAFSSRMEGKEFYSPAYCFKDMAWIVEYFIAKKVPFFTGDNLQVWETVITLVRERAEFYATQAQFNVKFEIEDAGIGVSKLKTLAGDIDSLFRFGVYLAQHIAIEQWDSNLTPSGTRGLTVAEGLKVLFRMISKFHDTFWATDIYYSTNRPHNVWIRAVRNDLKNAYLSMGETTMAGTFEGGDGDTTDLPFSWGGSR